MHTLIILMYLFNRLGMFVTQIDLAGKCGDEVFDENEKEPRKLCVCKNFRGKSKWLRRKYKKYKI